MKRKFFAVIGALLTVCVLLTGCGSGDDRFLLAGAERNIIREEYDKNYNHYEDNLEVNKKAAEICVTGNVNSGTINLKVIEKNKDGSAARTFEYRITSSLNETIKLERGHSENWSAVIDFKEDTEGYYKIGVYG